jgi:hypothetical protein
LNFANAVYDQFKSGNVFSTGLVSATGNVTGGNILTGGLISATGNVTGSYIIGNGSTLSSITGSNVTGTVANATYATSAGSATTANSATTATSATTAGTVTTNAQPNITSVGTLTSVTITGNTTGGNLLTGGLVSATGNAIAGNILTAGLISATGNVTGNYIIGNGSQLTGIVVSGAMTWTTQANTAPTDKAPGSFWYDSYTGVKYQYINDGTSNVWVDQSYPSSFSTLAVSGNATVGGTLAVTGNLSYGNVTTAGIVSATGNITGGNVLTGGIVSATGNITGSYIIGNGSQLTGLPAGYANSDVAAYLASGTVSTAIKTTNIISATGNITSGNLSVGTGTVSVGNIVNANGNGVGNIGSSSLYFNTAFVKATSAQYADLAEMYVADASYKPGTVLEFGGDYEVRASQSSHSTTVAGIVSTEPSYLMNSAQIGDNVVAVALTGRVPCQVIGIIHKGDRLVASDHKGVATVLNMAYYEPGCIIGKALEDYNSDTVGVIEVAVGRT